MKHKATGHSYERQAIMNWIASSQTKKVTCPLTRKPLSPGDLLRNHELQEEITTWRQLQEVEKLLVKTGSSCNLLSLDDCEEEEEESVCDKTEFNSDSEDEDCEAYDGGHFIESPTAFKTTRAPKKKLASVRDQYLSLYHNAKGAATAAISSATSGR